MRFLSVAERELRAAARQKATYRTRWITAAIFFALLVWLLWVFNGFRNRRAAPEVFEVFSILTFGYCLITGTAWTADCISSERRDGTLGLLFLTNLNSGEIIAGKLCSSALASVYALFAIFPMLALPLLMGGITFEHSRTGDKPHSHPALGRKIRARLRLADSTAGLVVRQLHPTPPCG